MDNMHKLKPGTTEYKKDFNAKNYKQLRGYAKLNLYSKISNYVKSKGYTMSNYIVKCCKYCMDNEIDMSDINIDD